MIWVSQMNLELLESFLCSDEVTGSIAPSLSCEHAKLFSDIAFDLNMPNSAADWRATHRAACGVC